MRSWFSMPFSLASGRRRCGALAVHIGHLYRSRHRARRDRSSRDALVVRSWFSMPFSGVGPPPSLSSRRPAIVQGERSSRDALVVRSWFSMSFFGVGPPPSLCALAVRIGRLYRSRHRAGQSFKSRRARCAFMVLDALFGVGQPPRCALAVPPCHYLASGCRCVVVLSPST